MAEENSGAVDRSGYQPDFELSHRGVIREDNWPQYEAQGFFATRGRVEDEDLVEELALAQDTYGTEYVYTGDAWSYEAERPLRHVPGTGIYVHPDGRANVAKWRAKHFPHEVSGSDPAAN